jgi:membrane protease YdiL (CAAX protease family)
VATMTNGVLAARERLAPWGAREALLGVGLVAGGSAALVGILALAALSAERPLSGALVPAVIVVPHLLMVSSAWYLGIRKHRVPWSTLGFRFPTGRLALLLPWPALLASLGASGIYVAVITALGLDSLLPSGVDVDILGEGVRRLVTVVLIGLAGPLVEELFFRGFLMTALVGPLGRLRAAVVTSIIFAAGHVDLGVMVPFFVSGMLLSWLYLRTRSIWPPFLAHATQNLLALWLMTAT